MVARTERRLKSAMICIVYGGSSLMKGRFDSGYAIRVASASTCWSEVNGEYQTR
jgi:hypothetical protein